MRFRLQIAAVLLIGIAHGLTLVLNDQVKHLLELDTDDTLRLAPLHAYIGRPAGGDYEYTLHTET